jgi:site-specific recombinase XerC
MLGLGRVGDPARGRQTFERYVEETWFPNHQVEVTTRQVYSYCLRKHILPEFGPMKMVEILPEHVREWVTKMKDRGLSPALIAENKVILSGIFTTALNDQITFLHPCKGVKTPTVPVRPYTILTPEQFSAVYEALPDPRWRLMVETDIESGLFSWGQFGHVGLS